jgi:hypothetical protein
VQVPEHALQRSCVTATRIACLFVFEDHAEQVSSLFHRIGLSGEFTVH